MDAGSDPPLPPSVAAALAAPVDGERLGTNAAGIPFSALVWDGPAHAQATATGPSRATEAPRPLLLIHGITASAGTWWRIGPALAATGRRVVAIDLPGHGLTGHWTGHHRFRDMAADVAAFARAAGLARDELQVVGHSWGAMIAAALPMAGLRPATVVLLDPPALPHAVISLMLEDPDSRTYDDLDEAVAAVRRQNPSWTDRDVAASADALTRLDERAARSVLLDNGDWDGGLADLRQSATLGIPTWVVRGDPTSGGLMPDAALPEIEAIIGHDHVITIPGGAHSPHRLHPAETAAALLRALLDDPSPGASAGGHGTVAG
jgi:pimeloyl-ACP methyl ester carboxylesterase